MVAEVMKPDGRKLYLVAFAKAVRPRQRLTVSEWADAHRILSSKSSSEPGRWRTSRVPYLKEPMDCLSLHSPVEEVTFMKAAQLGVTTLSVNWIGYVIDHCPGPMLVTVPTDKLMEEWIAQDLKPMIDDTESVNEKMEGGSKKAANRKDLKEFPGGLLMLMGANSPDNFRQKKSRYSIRDDVDGWPLSVGKEGDPLTLLDNRDSTFARKKRLNISTPKMKGVSRIEEKFEKSDQRHYHVRCPDCAERIVFKWRQMHWTVVGGIVQEVWYVCEKCGIEIEEHSKTKMLKNGIWIADNPKAETRGYHLNAIYCPIGLGDSWRKLVVQWLDAQGDDKKEKVFINTKLGLPYEGKGHKMEPRALKERAEDYSLLTVPPGVLVLTVGLDTQDDRLPLQLIGHGRGGRMWVLDYLELDGDPNMVVDDFVQKKGALYEYLKRPLINAWGKEMFIQAVGWDTGGHRTDAVYTMTRSKVVSRLLALKSWSVRGKQVMAGRPSYQDVKWNGKTNKRGAALWMVGSDTAKDLILSLLSSDEDKPAEERKIRFSKDLDEDYYKMLLAEHFDPEKNKYVKKSGARNEAIDTFVYALAAARHNALRVHMKTKADWDALEHIYQPGGVEVVGVTDLKAGEKLGEIEEVEKSEGSSGGISLEGWGRG